MYSSLLTSDNKHTLPMKSGSFVCSRLKDKSNKMRVSIQAHSIWDLTEEKIIYFSNLIETVLKIRLKIKNACSEKIRFFGKVFQKLSCFEILVGIGVESETRNPVISPLGTLFREPRKPWAAGNLSSWTWKCTGRGVKKTCTVLPLSNFRIYWYLKLLNNVKYIILELHNVATWKACIPL